MTGYLSKTQVDKILGGINPARVSKDKQGNAYVQAYEVKAQMARVFGIARWSSDVIEQRCLVEREVKTKEGKDAWHVVWHSIVRVTVCAPDGTQLATYTEGHAGASTHPDVGEAHGNAITNSESYAFKRAASMALLDDGGLSLYGKGSTKPLVSKTLHYPFGEKGKTAESDVDSHITSVAEEVDTDSRPDPNVAVEPPKPDPRTSNGPQRVGMSPEIARLQARANEMAGKGKAS